MPIGIDMNNYDISMGTGQIRMSGGGNMTMSSSSVTNQGIYYDISGADLRTGRNSYGVSTPACTYAFGKFYAFPYTTSTANQVITSLDGITWTAQSGGNASLSPIGATYGPDASGVNRIVAVGAGTITSMTSTNGTSWTSVQIINGNNCIAVTNGKGRFVVVANGGTGPSYIHYSDYPSISWTAATGGPQSVINWYHVTYGNGTFVAVNSSAAQSNQVAYSTDGATWSYATAATSSSWQAVAYGNGLFAAVSSTGNIMTSPDGITWTARTSPTTAINFRSLIFGNGLFVGLSHNTNPGGCIVSQDGITWSLRGVPIINFYTLSIAYGQTNTGINRFVALPDASSNLFFTIDARNTDISSNLAKNNVFIGNDISMTDGLPAGYNWMTQNQNISNLRGICYGVPTTGPYKDKGLFVAVSENASPFSNVRTSVDGINWVAQTTDASANQGWNSVCFGTLSDGSGIFVAVSYAATTTSIMTSYNGITWTVRTVPILSTSRLQSIAFGNGVFVAVCGNGTRRIFRSADGITWSNAISTSPDSFAWRGITYGNGRFVAVGDSGNYMYSTDGGLNWTTGTLTTNNWYQITYGNGLFVAVSNSGTGNRVMTSPDGITWTNRTSAADNSWYGLTYGNGLFVAGSLTGSSNRIMISQDGINWTCRNVPNDEYATIAYGVVSSGIYAGQGIFVSASYNSSNCIISVPGAQNNIAIGNNTTVDGVNSVAIGYGAKCTASNQVVIGSSTTNTSSILLNGSNISTTLDGKLTISQSSECSLTNAPSVSYGQTSTLGFGFAGGISGTAYRWQIKDVTLNRDNGAGPNYDYGAQSKLIFSAKSNNTFSNTTSDRTLIDGLTLVPNSGGNGGLSSGINVGINTTAPGATLDVSGNFKIKNTSTITGIQFGVVAQGTATGTVTFPVAFSGIPVVTTTIATGSTSQVFSINISSVSTTQFNYAKTYILTNRTDGGPAVEGFFWIAICA